MKKRNLLLLLIMFTLVSYNYIIAETFDVRSNGFAFSPDEIFIAPGDTIDFNIGSFHNAVEVNQETWEANDTIYNGGFRLPFGGGQLVLNELGTYYFVCTPHASLGMKGIIYVEELSSINTLLKKNKIHLKIFPNPASENINLSFIIENSSDVKIEVIDITGRIVRSLINSTYQPGVYRESFYLNNLRTGRYMIHIITDSVSEVKPLIITD